MYFFILRRIARQNRQNNVYTQTDIVPTKLMKEISSDTNNLIKTRDQGILTDDTPILTIRDNLRGIRKFVEPFFFVYVFLYINTFG